jgi:hypothetical protein
VSYMVIFLKFDVFKLVCRLSKMVYGQTTAVVDPRGFDGGFSEVDNASTYDVNFSFDTTTSTARNLTLSDAEDMDTSWPLHSSGPSKAPSYNFDFIPTSDQGYPYRDMDYLTHFGFNPTVATLNPNSSFHFLPSRFT